MKKFILVIAIFSQAACTRIGPGHVGIVVNLAGTQRGVSDFPVTTGWVVYLPGKTQVFEYPTYVQTYVWTKNEREGNASNEEITFTTKDSLLVAVDINVSYALQAEKVPAFYVKFRNDDLRQFTHGFLRNTARDCINEVAGRYAIEQIMGDNSKFIKESRQCVHDLTSEFGVHIEQFGIIGAPRPPETVIAAINAKAQANQIAMQKQLEILQAEAEAKKAIAKAEGEAESNRRLTLSLSPNLLEWRKLQITEQAIQRWKGDMPSALVGDGKGLLFNIPR